MQDSFLWLFAGLLFIGISIPLIFAIVPPNRWYGFRVAKTFSSERIWYAANRAAGFDLLCAGLAIALTALITRQLAIAPPVLSAVNGIVFVGALAIALIHSFLTLSRLE